MDVYQLLQLSNAYEIKPSCNITGYGYMWQKFLLFLIFTFVTHIVITYVYFRTFKATKFRHMDL